MGRSPRGARGVPGDGAIRGRQNKLTVTQAQAVIAAAILRQLHAIITTGRAWDPRHRHPRHPNTGCFWSPDPADDPSSRVGASLRCRCRLSRPAPAFGFGHPEWDQQYNAEGPAATARRAAQATAVTAAPIQRRGELISAPASNGPAPAQSTAAAGTHGWSPLGVEGLDDRGRDTPSIRHFVAVLGGPLSDGLILIPVRPGRRYRSA